MPIVKQQPPMKVPNRAIAVGAPKTSRVPLASTMQLTPVGAQINRLRTAQTQTPQQQPAAQPQPAAPQAPASQPANLTMTAGQGIDYNKIANAPGRPRIDAQPVLKQAPAPAAPTGAAPPADPSRPAMDPAYANRQPITGNETPYRVNPGQSDELQGLLAQIRGMVSGGGQGGMAGDPEIQAALKRSAMEQIANPDVYGSDLMQGAMEQARRELESFYNTRVQGVKDDLGARGLAYSKVANDDFNTVASEAGRAYQDMIRPLLRERAQSMGSAREAAFRNAMGLEDQGMRRSGQLFGQLGDVIGLQHGIETGLRDEERGERAYVDDLRRTARSDAIEEMLLGEDMRRSREGDFQQVLQDAYRQGDPGAADSVLRDAGYRADDEYAGGQDLLAMLAQEAFGRQRAA